VIEQLSLAVRRARGRRRTRELSSQGSCPAGGGLVMWVPESIPYLVAGLAIVAVWLSSARIERHRG